MTPEKITNLLMATRHADDLCVPECKDGPSMGRKSRRLDLWTMKRSYTNFATIGYEIKVSRSDFLADNKWQDYLPLCHQLFFVTPWGLVEPSEVPGNVEFLVRAVNSHEDLKNALEDVELRCTQARIASDIGNESGLKKAGFLCRELEHICKAVREALNKVEGNTSGV